MQKYLQFFLISLLFCLSNSVYSENNQEIEALLIKYKKGEIRTQAEKEIISKYLNSSNNTRVYTCL